MEDVEGNLVLGSLIECVPRSCGRRCFIVEEHQDVRWPVRYLVRLGAWVADDYVLLHEAGKV